MKKICLMLAATILSGVLAGNIAANAELSHTPAHQYTNEFSYEVYGGENSNNLTNSAIYRGAATVGYSPADQGTKELVSGVSGKPDADYSLAISREGKGAANYYIGPVYDSVNQQTENNILYLSIEMANYDNSQGKDIYLRLRQYDSSNVAKTINKKVVTMGKDGKVTSELNNSRAYDYTLEKMYRFDFVFNRVSGAYTVYIDGHIIAEGTATDIVPSDTYPTYELNANNSGTSYGFQIGAYNNSTTETIKYAIDNIKYEIYHDDAYTELCSMVISEAYKDWDDENDPIAAYSYANGFDYSVYGGDKIVNATDSTNHFESTSAAGYTVTEANPKLTLGAKGDCDYGMELSTTERTTAAWYISPIYDNVTADDKQNGNKNILYFSSEMANSDPYSDKYINLSLKVNESKQVKSIIKMGKNNLITSDLDANLSIPYRSYVMYKFDLVFDRINGNYAVYMDGDKISSGTIADMAISDTITSTAIFNNKTSTAYGFSVGFWNPTAGVKSSLTVDNLKYEAYKTSSFAKICALVEASNANIKKNPIVNRFSSSVDTGTTWKTSFFKFLNFSDGNANGNSGNKVSAAEIASNIAGRASNDSSLFVKSLAGTYSNKYTAREPKLFYNIDAYDNDRSQFLNDWVYSDNDSVKLGLSFMIPDDENIKPYNKMFVALRSKEHGDRTTVEFDFNEAKIATSMDVGEFKRGKWYRYETIYRNGGADENVMYVDHYLDGTKLNDVSSVINGKISSIIDVKIAFDSDCTLSEDGLTFTINRDNGIYIDDLFVGAPSENEYKAFTLPQFADGTKHQDVIGYYATDSTNTVADTISAISNISNYDSRTVMDADYESVDEASTLPVIGKYIKLVEDGQEIYITFAKKLSIDSVAVNGNSVTVNTTGMDTDTTKVIIAAYNAGELVSAQINDYDFNAMQYTNVFDHEVSDVKVFAWNLENMIPTCENKI